jgi:phosphatidylinositol 4-kinase B
MVSSQPETFILPQSYFGPEWGKTKDELIQKSIYGKIASHQIKCYMVKSGDDLRQEYMAMQLISLLNEIFTKENIKIWMRPYSIIPYSSDSGLIEFIDDTRTISYLKEVSHERSLRNIYKQIFGGNWEASITNFIQSLAGYSLIQYLFDIKDRHNNNILVDVYGHIIHIDFSFMLSSSPGNMNFERAPFKLTRDYIELMEGEDSDIFKHFKLLFFLGLKYLRKYKKEIMELIMMMTECKGMKCFIKFDRLRLEAKFCENTTDEELEAIVESVIRDACNSYTTSQYDMFQWWTNRIEI